MERFPILAVTPWNYPKMTQEKFVNACATLLNFIMRKPTKDGLCQCHCHEVINIDQEDNEDNAVGDEPDNQYTYRLSDTVGSDMWNA